MRVSRPGADDVGAALVTMLDDIRVKVAQCGAVGVWTPSVAGESLGMTPEHAPPAPASPYAGSKLAAERLLGHLCAADPEWRVSILRYFNVAGGFDDPQAEPLRSAADTVSGEALTTDGKGSAAVTRVNLGARAPPRRKSPIGIPARVRSDAVRALRRNGSDGLRGTPESEMGAR